MRHFRPGWLAIPDQDRPVFGIVYGKSVAATDERRVEWDDVEEGAKPELLGQEPAQVGSVGGAALLAGADQQVPVGLDLAEDLLDDVADVLRGGAGAGAGRL